MIDVFRRHHDEVRSAEDAVRFLQEWLATTGVRVVGGLLSSAWRAPDARNASAFLLARMMLFEHERTPRSQCPYPSVRLDECWIPRHELVGFVANLLTLNMSGDGKPFFHQPRAESIFTLRSSQLQSGWPETQLKLTSVATRVDPEWMPAVAHGLPPFQTWAQAVGNWVFGVPFRYGPDMPYSGQLVVILPDTRARVGKLSGVAGDGLRVPVETAGPADFELKWVLTQDGVEVLKGEKPFTEAGEIEIPFADEATQLDVYCVSKATNLVSHRGYSWRELRAAGKRADAQEHQVVLEELAGGEREDVEFKPFLSPDHEKLREIEKTVVAFANTIGGRIYVGVNDEGQPQGRAALRKLRSKEEVTLAVVMAALRKLIHDRIKPVPSATFSETAVAGEPIGVIDVAPSSQVHATHDNDIYIRKGSTNRKPDPTSELVQLYAGRQSGSSVADDGDIH